MVTVVRYAIFLILCVWLQVSAARGSDEQGTAQIHHELTLSLTPAAHRLQAEDVISFPATALTTGEPLRFLLHADLQIESADADYVLEHAGIAANKKTDGVPLRAYRLRPAGETWPTNPKPRLRFQGEIYHPLTTEQESYARRFSGSSGIIGEQGVMLSGSAFWVPWFGDHSVSFRLTVTVPANWEVVSQGERIGHERQDNIRQITWDSPKPMEEIYLIAGPFTEYSHPAGGARAYAFLREPDAPLAQRYLEATAYYLAMYDRLIGPYPYKKFALIENFWETGYGMPSFTLLGPRVIRLPFILHSSYPHEILHNWWGNGVYVDYTQGNWSEGLTAYLADHLIKEQQGQGIEYRRDTLKKYRNFVRAEKDFPLTAFRARHSSASAAIGYGKSLMLWHMLRLRLGDEKFIQGLQRFYRQYQFRRASFADLEKIFSEAARENLTPFFEQWVERSGAPALTLSSELLDAGRIKVKVRQHQPGAPYRLMVPLAVTVAGEPQAQLFPLMLQERESIVELTLPALPLRVDLDPYFDVFRRLDRRELPATLGELFGAGQVTLVLPEGKDAITPAAWQNFARAWSQGRRGQFDVIREQDLRALPKDRAVWILGQYNRWRRVLFPELRHLGAEVVDGEIRIDGARLPAAGHSFVFTVRHPGNPDLAVGWIGSDQETALPGLARKLPHYGNYSFLTFVGNEPDNVIKGEWPVLDSPLVDVLIPPDNLAKNGAAVPRGELPEREPLVR